MSTKRIQIIGNLGTKVYTQNDEPIDAADGALWLDLDAESVGIPFNAVSYDAQTPTTEQQAQARANVGAASAEDVAFIDNELFEVDTAKNLVNPENNTVGGLQSDGSISTAGSWASYQTSEFIPVEQNTTYTLAVWGTNTNSLRTTRKVSVLYDSNKTVIAGSYQNIDKQEQITINTGNASYVRVSGQISVGDTDVRLQLEKGPEFTSYEPYIGGVKKVKKHPSGILCGKKWVAFGDSFTHAGYSPNDGFDESVYKFQSGKYAGEHITYPYIIAERNDMEVVRFFQGGRTLANPADGTFTNSITNPACVAYYQNVPEDADYITIYLGINDSHHESGTSGTDGEDVTGVIPLGNIEDTDETTFCGAWNVVLPWLMVNRPNAHIGIIVSNGCDRVEYRNATIAAAKKWGIPYLDLNGDERCPAMIRTKNPDISDEAKEILKQKWRVSETNTHPNTAAQYYQSTFIENWLRSL